MSVALAAVMSLLASGVAVILAHRAREKARENSERINQLEQSPPTQTWES